MEGEGVEGGVRGGVCGVYIEGEGGVCGGGEWREGEWSGWGDI